MNMAIAFPGPSSAVPSAHPSEILKLADVLVQQNLISQAQLEQVLALQRKTGKKVGRLLIEAGWINEDLLARGLARQLKIPFVNLKTYSFRPELVKLLPETAARRFRALVLDDLGDSLQVVLADPLDLFAFDELTRILKRMISISVAPENQLSPAFDRLYRRTDEISDALLRARISRWGAFPVVKTREPKNFFMLESCTSSLTGSRCPSHGAARRSCAAAPDGSAGH